MIRRLAIIALGFAIWAGAYAVPGHTGGWGILRGLMIALGSMIAGFQCGRIEDELRWRITTHLRWRRTRRNARKGRGWAGPDEWRN